MKIAAVLKKVFTRYEVLLPLFLGGFILVVYLSMSGTRLPQRTAAITTADVVGLSFRSYEGERSNVEISCREADRLEFNRMRMRDISASIRSGDPAGKPMRMSSAQGEVDENFDNMQFDRQVKIDGADFSLRGERMRIEGLKQNTVVKSENRIDFTVGECRGTAKKGTEVFLDLQTYKFYQLVGSWGGAERRFTFAADVFWWMAKEKKMLLERNGEMVTGEGRLESDWIDIQFNPDGGGVSRIAAMKPFTFRQQEQGEKTAEGRELQGGMCELLYDEQSNPTTMKVQYQAVGLFSGGGEQSEISGDEMQITFDSASHRLRDVRLPKPGKIVRQGKDPFTVSGNLVQLQFRGDGRIEQMRAEQSATFSAEAFNGSASTIAFNAGRDELRLDGPDSRLRQRKNSFTASNFLIQLAKGELFANRGIKADVQLNAKGGGLFSARKPVYISSEEVRLKDGEQSVRFSQAVKLYQDETELHCQELLIDNKKNLLQSTGAVTLKYRNPAKESFLIRGDSVLFDSQANTVTIKGNASLYNEADLLKARTIVLHFDKQNNVQSVEGMEQVEFVRQDLNGKSQNLVWQYAKKLVTFRESAVISRRNGGSTAGKVLTLDLSTNQITVSSEGTGAQ